jgi:hypothetical protein
MKDEYTSAFYDIIREAQSNTGFDLPTEIEAYIVMLLSSKIDKANFLPKKTFAEEFLKLQKPYKQNAKELGDTCLFLTGVFPEYGIGVRYYSDIGKTSYTLVQKNLHGDLFYTLATRFDFISNFINIAVRQKNSPITAIR